MTIDAIVILFSSNNPKTKDTFSISNRLVLLDKQVLNLSSGITVKQHFVQKSHETERLQHSFMKTTSSN
jgi:hypothetical protein